MRLKGGRTGKRAVVCERTSSSTGLMQPFDLEVWYGERVAVLGSNGSGKSHFLRLLAAGGSDPDVEHQPVGDVRDRRRSRTPGTRQARRARAPGLVRADPRAPRAGRPHPAGDPAPRRRRTGGRAWAASRPPGCSTATSWRTPPSRRFESLSGGQQARFQILLLELSGATLLLLDEPTDNLDVQSAEALEDGPGGLRRARCVAVTHDRWFARGFDRFLVYGADGEVYESDGPVWDEGRVQRRPLSLVTVPTRVASELVRTVLRSGGDRLRTVLTRAGDRSGLRSWWSGVRVEGERDRAGLAAADVGDGDRVAGAVGPDGRDQRVGAGDQVVVDLGDHVAGSSPALRRGGAGVHLADRAHRRRSWRPGRHRSRCRR